MRVRKLEIREIFATNSRKTLEVDLETDKAKVRSSVPMGTSRGKHEVVYLPTDVAVRKFNIIRTHFTSEQFSDQKDVDDTLHLIDKSKDFREIGGNVALAISSAFLKAFAAEEGKEVFEFLGGKAMPKPLCNVIGGWKGNRSDIQEFLLLPVHQRSFLDSVEKISNAYLKIGEILAKEDPLFSYGRNVESAWVTTLPLEEALKILTKVANEYLLKIGLDVAASQLWDGNRYYVYPYSNRILNWREQVDFMVELARNYPIIFLEDPFHEDDFVSFSTLTSMLSGKLVCADDLYATNIERLKHGLDFKAANAVIVKPSQIGTVSGVTEFVKRAKENKLITVMSHRSGETEDTLICHLAVGLGCDYVKLGIGGERTVKINEMIRIEEKLKSSSYS
jgi:enolase